MTPDEARAELALLLQLAYSGELGAIRAYLGHRASLRDRGERRELDRILREEIVHRRCVLRMLRSMGSEPDPRRERKLDRVGRTIAFLCGIGGWFVPMYGAGRLERDNVGEYEHAARLAVVCGRADFVDELLEMAEVEWDHERWFREKAASHALWRLVPHWPRLPPREDIRRAHAAFVASGSTDAGRVRVPMLVR